MGLWRAREGTTGHSRESGNPFPSKNPNLSEHQEHFTKRHWVPACAGTRRPISSQRFCAADGVINIFHDPKLPRDAVDDIAPLDEASDTAVDVQAIARGPNRIFLDHDVANARRSRGHSLDLDMRILLQPVAAHDDGPHQRRKAWLILRLPAVDPNYGFARRYLAVRSSLVDIALDDPVIEQLQLPTGLEMEVHAADGEEPSGSDRSVAGEDVVQRSPVGLGGDAGVLEHVVDDQVVLLHLHDSDHRAGGEADLQGLVERKLHLG